MQQKPGHNVNHAAEPPRLSYKFQRLRERIRRSILSGEFTGRLPGERALAERYCANAKTINKALGDLAADGLVVRHIGRGTFVAKRHQDRESGELPGKPARRFASLAPARAERREQFDRELGEALAENGDEFLSLRTSNGVAGLTLGDWPKDARRDTDGLFLPVPAALSDAGRTDEALILHACRRQVPLVTVGACAGSSKLNAVAPDFVDGGFRLAEHLFRLDCRTVIAVTNEVTRETIATLNGVHTAAARFGGQVVESPMRMDDAGRSVITVGRDDMDRTTGIILIGSAAIAAFLDDARLVAEWNGGRWAVCALPDIGDPRAAQAGLTTYESDPGTVCRWAARLMNDTRPGRRPVEFLIPGLMNIRETVRTQQERRSPPATAGDPPSPLREVAI